MVKNHLQAKNLEKISHQLVSNENSEIEEFSNLDQSETSNIKITEIPVFNIPEILSQLESSVASLSKSTNISMTPEIKHVEPIDDKSELPSEISPSLLKPEISHDLPQREARLRQKAIEFGEDPDKFVTITKKDKLDSIAFRDKMQTNARMCSYAKEAKKDLSEYVDMIMRERLISEEIIRCSLEKDGITLS
ncbi:hypothetical protein Glove_117g271 [Diversispora epigaea]|uniref:Uncharacterized protein n=1 Tax=Diversispora epigaea TaxID=1348612 RepID=A0A397JA51_9GLOM|nr:hypothetical protein Glove_117g271 [Diversispora epigaea]